MLGFHDWLLNPDVDLLPALLLPLAGPEQFSEEEIERLPLDLQYLPDDKERESDPDIRRMLLESLLKVRLRCYLVFLASHALMHKVGV